MFRRRLRLPEGVQGRDEHASRADRSGAAKKLIAVVSPLPGEGWPNNKGHDLSSLPERVRRHLTELARRRETITYRDLAATLDVQPPNTIHQVADALEVLMREDHKNRAPFLAALVVSKVRQGFPAPVFFSFALSLGRFSGSGTGPESRTWHASQLKSAWDFWGR